VPYLPTKDYLEPATRRVYRVGVRQFEKGNLDKAENAFNAVLLANGLNQQAHYYLAKINVEQGDKETAAKHALALEAYKTSEK